MIPDPITAPLPDMMEVAHDNRDEPTSESDAYKAARLFLAAIVCCGIGAAMWAGIWIVGRGALKLAGWL